MRRTWQLAHFVLATYHWMIPVLRSFLFDRFRLILYRNFCALRILFRRGISFYVEKSRNNPKKQLYFSAFYFRLDTQRLVYNENVLLNIV